MGGMVDEDSLLVLLFFLGLVVGLGPFELILIPFLRLMRILGVLELVVGPTLVLGLTVGLWSTLGLGVEFLGLVIGLLDVLLQSLMVFGVSGVVLRLEERVLVELEVVLL
jgi:hypothetical protein